MARAIDWTMHVAIILLLGLGAWFSFEGGEFRPYFPVRLAVNDSEPAG